jgi:hypothetical protein
MEAVSHSFLLFLQSILNCGFVEWVDPKWPSAMQKVLARLWEMYEGVTNAIME